MVKAVIIIIFFVKSRMLIRGRIFIPVFGKIGLVMADTAVIISFFAKRGTIEL